MRETILVSALGGPESSSFSRDFQRALRAANADVAVVRVRISKRPRGRAIAPSHGVFLIRSPSIRLRASLLGHVERLLIALKTLGAPVLRAGRGRILGGLSRRFQAEARLAALRARRLDAAASEEVEALFDVLDPALVVSLHPGKGRELPLLAAAYRRRTPLVAVIRDKRALASISMPAARFARCSSTTRVLRGSLFDAAPTRSRSKCSIARVGLPPKGVGSRTSSLINWVLREPAPLPEAGRVLLVFEGGPASSWWATSSYRSLRRGVEPWSSTCTRCPGASWTSSRL